MAAPLGQTYLDAIKRFEGYSPRASWDYKQNSNGYGTRARYAGEKITSEEADARFQTEVGNARAIVDQFAPDAPEGVKAALTSLTYNAGGSWMQSGLGQAVKSGDYATAKDRFLQYNKAGGETLPGLVDRRTAEAAWFDGPSPTDSSPVSQNESPSGIVDRVATYLAPNSTAPHDANGERSALSSLFGSLSPQQPATGAVGPPHDEAEQLRKQLDTDVAAGLDSQPQSLLPAKRRPVDLTKLRAAIAARRGLA